MEPLAKLSHPLGSRLCPGETSNSSQGQKNEPEYGEPRNTTLFCVICLQQTETVFSQPQYWIKLPDNIKHRQSEHIIRPKQAPASTIKRPNLLCYNYVLSNSSTSFTDFHSVHRNAAFTLS
ncbi:hypothetical protein FPSE5266_20310 [Fusarium pseudograminearum]|nr:hypothetical protein FPSE5266_20310 [Fusarium pseudograminearum]